MFLPFAFRFSPFPITITIHRDGRLPFKGWLIESPPQGNRVGGEVSRRARVIQRAPKVLIYFGFQISGHFAMF